MCTTVDTTFLQKKGENPLCSVYVAPYHCNFLSSTYNGNLRVSTYPVILLNLYMDGPLLRFC